MNRIQCPFLAPILMVACVILLPSCQHAPGVPCTMPAPPNRAEWLDAEGHPRHPFDTRAHPATVFFFIGAECPISNGYAPEIGRIAETYGARGVAFYAVHPDPGLSTKDAEGHARAFGYRFPVLLDPTQSLTRRIGTTMTPEAAVLDREGNVTYLGRIDDVYYGFGKRRQAVTTHELRDAVDATLAGRAATPSGVPPIGCEIAPPPRQSGP